MKILITGVAGFIGFHVCKYLLECGCEVVGIDNINSYYDVNLKYSRLSVLGITKKISNDNFYPSELYTNFGFVKLDIEDRVSLSKLFDRNNFDTVCHLAAQAGVRYSLENPYSYIKSNVDGFLNILECCRNNSIKHLVYASSSSVYGLNSKVPFSEKDDVCHPVSLYAATKKANELMAHTYSYLYNLPTTGLRFFTVYGPWGRPDMAPFLFTDAILNNRPIKIFNNGDMLRDFTYIDDIVNGVVEVIHNKAKSNLDWKAEKPDPSCSIAPYRIYNIGNSNPVKLMDFIQAFETSIGKKAIKEYFPMQPGDVYKTYADISLLQNDLDFFPQTSVEEGVEKTVNWFKSYYNL